METESWAEARGFSCSHSSLSPQQFSRPGGEDLLQKQESRHLCSLIYLFICLFNSGLCNMVGWRMPDAAHARAAQVLSWWDAWLCHPPSWDTTLTRLSKEGCSLLGVNNLSGKLLMSHQEWQGRSQSVLVNEASQRKSLLMGELISDPSPITPLRNAGTSFDV